MEPSETNQTIEEIDTLSNDMLVKEMDRIVAKILPKDISNENQRKIAPTILCSLARLEKSIVLSGLDFIDMRTICDYLNVPHRCHPTTNTFEIQRFLLDENSSSMAGASFEYRRGILKSFFATINMEPMNKDDVATIHRYLSVLKESEWLS